MNTIDFNILAVNLAQTGKSFSQGNFDYSGDGKVDTIDFNLLASNFGQTLAAASARAVPRLLAASLPASRLLTTVGDMIAAALFGDQVMA